MRGDDAAYGRRRTKSVEQGDVIPLFISGRDRRRSISFVVSPKASLIEEEMGDAVASDEDVTATNAIAIELAAAAASQVGGVAAGTSERENKGEGAGTGDWRGDGGASANTATADVDAGETSSRGSSANLGSGC